MSDIPEEPEDQEEPKSGPIDPEGDGKKFRGDKTPSDLPVPENQRFAKQMGIVRHARKKAAEAKAKEEIQGASNLKYLIDRDREDANRDSGPQDTLEDTGERNDWAAEYLGRNRHFWMGHQKDM